MDEVRGWAIQYAASTTWANDAQYGRHEARSKLGRILTHNTRTAKTPGKSRVANLIREKTREIYGTEKTSAKTCPKTNEKARNHEKPAKTQYFIVENLREFITTKTKFTRSRITEHYDLYGNRRNYYNQPTNRYVLRRNLHK